MSLVISLWMKLPIFFINQASHSKNGSQRQVIRYDPNIYADAPNQSLTLSVNGPLEWVVNLALYATAKGRFNQGPRGRNREVIHYISNAFEVTPISLFFLRTFNLLPPANEVCERLCFYTCLSVHGGWYPSMPCRSLGPHPGGGWGVWLGGGYPGPHPGGKLSGLAGGSPGPHPRGRLRGLAGGGVSRPTPGGKDKGSGQGSLQAHNRGM